MTKPKIICRAGQYRHALGLTTREVASLCGISHVAYSNLEHGRNWPRKDTAVNVADALSWLWCRPVSMAALWPGLLRHERQTFGM